jgi:NAD-dependent deacetylase
MFEQEVKCAADLLRKARYAVALTGAGISTPSGLPDFRSRDSGMWEKVDPIAVASIHGFRRNPAAFFDWIRPLAGLMRDVRPNPAHYALARLEEMGYLKAIITQNVDMLHTRAGSHEVHEVHGHLRTATCVQCYKSYPTEPFIDQIIDEGTIPRCPECGGILKPDVILYGEQLPIRVLHAAQRAARESDVMLIAGSSLTVAPVSELPLLAVMNGARLILVNDEPTYMDPQAAVVIHADVADILPHIVAELEVE